MKLTPLSLDQIRPAGWLAAHLRETWEAGLPEGSPRWIRHALLVGEGKGKLLVRSWAKRAGVDDPFGLAVPDTTEAEGMDCYQDWEERAVRLVWLDPAGLRVAFYGPASVKAAVEGVPIELELETETPNNPRVEVRLYPEAPLEFTLFLRLPTWASGCLVTGDGASGAEADDHGWIALRRRWQRGDALHLVFDRANTGPEPE